MIESFSCDATEEIWKGRFSKKLPEDIQSRARRKLNMLNASATLDDLRVPPNNKLEKLSGDREGRYSIRINRQWRICFCFENGRATEVEIVDYH
ncbi:type II toxin-antitoxin system RelE/ParE family toxin [Desulfopila aestuarii]|uniref:Proteic killer suppression protein n=1 Tax=Desulfopila aestuarii DSM 18488 TaxID=1121416 RepID=A0A1M7YGY0_9BACT|nr:type II toxin-antitoxin system RelE/ParE family toxin [Desulfopila aestuarii]SHO51914.1 proteic killer suppression protein [Desulfopila aestuarii DSM 18488]